MTTTVSYCRRALAGIIAMLAFMIGGEAMAQQFQYVYGGSNCREAGRAVIQPSTGGYLAVGETFSLVAGCPGSDIYVVRTNPDGSYLWTFAYNISQYDSATDVIEDKNGNFVICGVTRQSNACNRGRDMFILKISSAGAVIAVREYGSVLDEIAWGIIEAQTGTLLGVTRPGDYVIAGYTNYNGNTNGDGFIVRVDVNLNLLWDEEYDASANSSDIFYDICEATVGVAMNQAADLVVVGSTSAGGFGALNVFICRVSGENGSIGAAPQGAAIYGDPYDDIGRAVVEVKSGTYAGDLIITGTSSSRPFPNTTAEVLMLQVDANPCTFIADQYAGDDGNQTDGGIDLKIDAHTAGRVIVTGYTHFGGGTVVPKNVFLYRFTIGTMAAVAPGMAYGGDTDDWGWSVNNATRSDADETPGYIVTGFTKSPSLITAVDPEQLYLIKTDITSLRSFCNEIGFSFLAEKALLQRVCINPNRFSIGQFCNPIVARTQTTWARKLCLSPVAATRERGGNDNDGVSGVESPAVISFKEGSVTSYPNPLTRGAMLNLRFDLASAATAHITVSDIVGRIIYENDATLESGSAVRPIGTNGWASGTYIVRIEIDGKASTTRVVLLDR